MLTTAGAALSYVAFAFAHNLGFALGPAIGGLGRDPPAEPGKVNSGTRFDEHHFRVMALLFAPFKKFMPSRAAAASRVMSCTVNP